MTVRLVGGSFAGEIDLPIAPEPAEIPELLTCRTYADFHGHRAEIKREDYRLMDAKATPPLYKHP